MNIPDLRHVVHEITIEHCHVLIARFADAVTSDEDLSMLANEIDPEIMKEHFETLFSPEMFTRLFSSDLGKGVLVGTYAQSLLDMALMRANEEEV